MLSLSLHRKIKPCWQNEIHCKRSNLEAYKSFLSEIGYLVPEGEEFAIFTENVDPEISTIADPQFVVPLTNTRLP